MLSMLHMFGAGVLELRAWEWVGCEMSGRQGSRYNIVGGYRGYRAPPHSIANVHAMLVDLDSKPYTGWHIIC